MTTDLFLNVLRSSLRPTIVTETYTLAEIEHLGPKMNLPAHATSLYLRAQTSAYEACLHLFIKIQLRQQQVEQHQPKALMMVWLAR